ncbi:MAG: hypothetical protein LBG69_00175 [Zoogloeaceae bacterium]|jgi:hypothetical protein|nr:hypothetical protein [Zoogloeaceae bacterium]
MDMSITILEAFQSAGIEQEKAKAVAESINQAIDNRYSIHSRTLATQGDIEKVRADVEKLATKIAETETRLLKWLVGVGVAIVITLYSILNPILTALAKGM